MSLQWFKKHPQFLRDESTKLSNDSNYKELYQCRDNLFISHGDILVRLDKLYRYPILIVYSNATPFLLPATFPLIRNLTKEEMDGFAALEAGQLFERIKPLVLFYHKLRHQNSSGELCVLERENLEDGNDFYGITTILKRLRDWHAGHTTNHYPPDSEEVDFCSHFNFINKEMKLIYTEQYLNKNLIDGDCYAILYKSTPHTRFLPFVRQIYLSCYFDGVTKSGLIEETDINIERYFLDGRIKTSVDLVAKPTVVKELKDSGQLLKAQWFHIDNEPAPFETINDLVTIIGNGDFDEGIERLAKRCKETFATIENSIFIALRFPNKKGILEFQLFKIYKLTTPPEYVLQFNDRDKIIEMLKQYQIVEAIKGEKVTEQTFHQRNSTRADYEILKESHLNVFGVGAIGSEIADSAAKAGIAEITLVDDQQLNVHNAVRHLAGIDMTDEFKVYAVAEIIHHHNHFIKVNPWPFNLYSLEYNFLHDDSISVSSVADDYAEGFINQKAARVFRVIPGKDACFYCMSLYKNDKNEFIDIPDDPEYPTLKNECNNPIRPGSAADLKFIAAFTSRLLIDHIQKGDSESNHWIWTSEKIGGTVLQTANQVYQQYIPPHTKCPYCNNDKKINAEIPNSVLLFMQDLVKQNPTIETGGVLAGYVDENGNVIITHASGPGPKASQSGVRFEKDIEYCQEFLNKLFVQSARKIVYVGEWHSHPSKNNNPSGLDIKSFSEIAVEKGYLTDEPVMIILSSAGKPSCTMHPAGKRFYYAGLSVT
jgi:integrative and conjugative element protein (TIGR02256 family)